MKRGMQKKLYTAPGSLIYTGNQSGNAQISIIRYNSAEVAEEPVRDINDIMKALEYKGNVYIEIRNVSDISAVESIGNMLQLHRLVLEDILSVNQRAKIEEYKHYTYMSAYGVRNRRTDKENTINISLILRGNAVIAFIDGDDDYFASVKNRILDNMGIVRSMKSDYLFYILTDTIIDSYYGYLQSIDEISEEIENSIMNSPDKDILVDIYKIKRQLILVKKILWPTRDMILKMHESDRFSEKTLLFIRDLTDNILHILEITESLREVMSGILDIHLTQISNRMNEIMKVLTVIATIFIPLTFVAGIYGMNFIYMPELQIKWAYPAIWIIMGLISLTMICYFKRKKWF